MADNKKNTPESSPEMSPGTKKSCKEMEERMMKGNKEFETYAKKQSDIAHRDLRALNREFVKDMAKNMAEYNASILKEFKPSVSTKKGSTNKK